jgi:hypothetical protein
MAFDGLMRRLLPDRSSVEYGLVTALYAFMPVFVVHAIFLNMDYGVTAFFVLFLYFLVAGRLWLASVFAVATMFSNSSRRRQHRSEQAQSRVASVSAACSSSTIARPRSSVSRVSAQDGVKFPGPTRPWSQLCAFTVGTVIIELLTMPAMDASRRRPTTLPFTTGGGAGLLNFYRRAA